MRLVILAALVASCGGTPPPAAPVDHASVAPVAADAAEAAAPAPTATPSAVPWDTEAACRRRHCYDDPDVRACFDTCYKYSHPQHPDLHANCDASCRAGHDVDACDSACGMSAMAFTPVQVTSRDHCRSALASCRRECLASHPGRVSICEVECLPTFERCRAPADVPRP